MKVRLFVFLKAGCVSWSDAVHVMSHCASRTVSFGGRSDNFRPQDVRGVQHVRRVACGVSCRSLVLIK